MSNGTASQKNIAYFAMRGTHDRQGQVGAMLVTDGSGIPQEFRVTLPVKPSAPQKALYGDQLQPFVTLELCGKPLCEALDAKPIAVLVEERSALALRNLVDLPVFYLEKSAERLTASSGAGDSSIEKEKRLTSGIDGIEPVSAFCAPGFEEELNEVAGSLQEIMEAVDLTEPFERISTAVTVLSERDDKFN